MAQMFRTFRAHAGLWGLSRVPLTVHARIRRDGGAMAVQGVRIKRPLRAKYIFGSVIGAVLLFNAFTRIVLAPLDKLAEELDNEESKEDSKATEDVDDSFFIPFPGTIKSVPQSPYRGSDPEWQEYIKFNTDLALQKKAKADLAEITRRILTGVANTKNAKITRYWLDISFPAGPPRSFVRSGIEITDDSVYWSTLPVDQATVLRTWQAYFPYAVTKATWNWLQVLFSLDAEKTSRRLIRAAYGLPDLPNPKKTYDVLEPNNNNATEDKITQTKISGGENGVTAETRNYKHSTGRQIQESADKQPDGIGEKTLSTQSNTAPVAKNEAGQGSLEQTQQLIKTIRHTESAKKLAKRYAYANVAWKSTKQVYWKQVKAMARGSIVVSGMVQLETPREIFVLDTVGFWNPKIKAFDIENSHFQIRRRSLKQQHPLIE